ncbi:hypothetical protein BGW37DRAFT_537737 [Umbelopsis sp. PMI_123]|nr:hypothetical protein BGW37DRAFT_537737 [Umbelopsis sp. PMI_123]
MELSTAHPRIAIIGGGLSGLIAARVLQIHSINPIIFERDQSCSCRGQGGTLDMHVESGQVSLRTAKLRDEFEQFARYESQSMRLLDKTGKVYLDRVSFSDNNDRPEIDRKELRNILLNSLEDGTVRWNQCVQRIDQKDGKYAVVTNDDHSELFDIVIDADGAWSKDTDLTLIESWLYNTKNRYPEITKLVGDGTMAAREKGISIFAQRIGDGSICCYFTLSTRERDLLDLNMSNTTTVRQWLLEEYRDWAQTLKHLIEEADNYVRRDVYVLPVGYQWKSHPGVTLIGEAAHLMSPFGGQGANLAMLDGAELATAIAEAIHNNKRIDESIEAFEKKMWQRAEQPSRDSALGIQNSFSDNPIQNMLNRFQPQ